VPPGEGGQVDVLQRLRVRARRLLLEHVADDEVLDVSTTTRACRSGTPRETRVLIAGSEKAAIRSDS
jgi:hypothetical protein